MKREAGSLRLLAPPSWSVVPVLALTFAAALLLVACGGDGGSSGRPNLRKIPTATPYTTLPPPTIVSGEGLPANSSLGSDTYVVESGDTAADIAERFGVTLEELADANDATIEELRFLEVGQVLKIPSRATAGATPPPRATPRTRETPEPEADMQTYVVEDGDSASGIADRFGVTLEELAEANDTTIEGLRNLEVGQVLKIPPPSRTPEPEPTEAPTEEPAEAPTEEPTPEAPIETPTPEG